MVQNLNANPVFYFHVSSANAKGGKIEVREGSPKGKLMGSCKVVNTGGWTEYKTISCKLKENVEKIDLYFVFKGKGEELLRLDWFKTDVAGLTNR